MLNENLSEPLLRNGPHELTSWFNDLTLETILTGWQEQKHSLINARLDGYLNGESVQIDPKEILSLESIDKSFRLTNAQLFVPQIKNFCHHFEEQTGHVVSANLYYTPHSEAQCFSYHFDSQNSFVFQILGNKTWTFLRHEGEFLKETHEQEHVLNSFKKGKLAAEELNLRMEQGHLLEFPYCLIHKARNETSGPSAHLTFSYQVPTMGDLVTHFFESLFEKKISDRYLERMLLEDVTRALLKLNGANQNLLESFKKKFKEDQDLKRKEGRRYQ